MARKPSKLIQNTRKRLAKRRVKKKSKKLKRKSKRRKRRQRFEQKVEPLTSEIRDTRDELGKLGVETGVSGAASRSKSAVEGAASRSKSAVEGVLDDIEFDADDFQNSGGDPPGLADPFGDDSLGKGGSFIDVDGSKGSDNSGASWEDPFGGR